MVSFSEAFFMALLSIGHHDISNTRGYDLQQLECLSEAVFFESSNQSTFGKEAVALVIKNRKAAKGTSYCKEIARPKQFSYRNTSAYMARNLDFSNPHTQTKIRSVIHVAWRVKMGLEHDVTGGATHYINPNEATDFSWAKKYKKTTVIGNHHFYRKA